MLACILSLSGGGCSSAPTVKNLDRDTRSKITAAKTIYIPPITGSDSGNTSDYIVDMWRQIGLNPVSDGGDITFSYHYIFGSSRMAGQTFIAGISRPLPMYMSDGNFSFAIEIEGRQAVSVSSNTSGMISYISYADADDMWLDALLDSMADTITELWGAERVIERVQPGGRGCVSLLKAALKAIVRSKDTKSMKRLISLLRAAEGEKADSAALKKILIPAMQTITGTSLTSSAEWETWLNGQKQ